MFSKIVTKLTVFALRHKKLNTEQKNECVNALLDNLHALPIRSIISYNEQGTLLVNGKQVELEIAQRLREGAKRMLDNPARMIVRDQVAWLAVNVGIHQGNTLEQIMFAKTALWNGQEEDKLYKQLAQERVEFVAPPGGLDQI